MYILEIMCLTSGDNVTSKRAYSKKRRIIAYYIHYAQQRKLIYQTTRRPIIRDINLYNQGGENFKPLIRKDPDRHLF